MLRSQERKLSPLQRGGTLSGADAAGKVSSRQQLQAGSGLGREGSSHTSSQGRRAEPAGTNVPWQCWCQEQVPGAVAMQWVHSGSRAPTAGGRQACMSHSREGVLAQPFFPNLLWSYLGCPQYLAAVSACWLHDGAAHVAS